MGYCSICGSAAKARCMSCGQEICYLHRAGGSTSLWHPAEMVLAPHYSPPPEHERPAGTTCVDCAHAVDAEVYGQFGRDLGRLGSLKAVSRIASMGLHLRQGLRGKPRPVDQVAQSAGLLEESARHQSFLGWVIEALVALQEPGVIDFHIGTKVPARAGGLFRAEAPAHVKLRHLCSAAGWFLTYDHGSEYPTHSGLYIRPDGTVTKLPAASREGSKTYFLLPGSGEWDEARLRLAILGPGEDVADVEFDGPKSSTNVAMIVGAWALGEPAAAH